MSLNVKTVMSQRNRLFTNIPQIIAYIQRSLNRVFGYDNEMPPKKIALFNLFDFAGELTQTADRIS